MPIGYSSGSTTARRIAKNPPITKSVSYVPPPTTRYGGLEPLRTAADVYGGTAPRVAYPANTPGVVPTNVAGVSAPGGVPGGGVPGGGFPGADITDPYGGFAKPFLPGMAPTIFNEPQILLQQAMRQQGLNPTGGAGGLYNAVLPFADYANALAMLGLGQGSDLGQGGAEQAINWMGKYFQNLMTPGGRGIDFNEGLRALQGAGENSAIGQFLNYSTDPREQIQAFKSLALPLAASSLHPLFARAFENALNTNADQYLWSISGPGSATGNFGNYFGQNSPVF